MSPAQLMIDNPQACGIGQGVRCCAYLLAGAQGFECGRVTSLASHLKRRAEAGGIYARRLPEEPFPQCQLSDVAVPGHDEAEDEAEDWGHEDCEICNRARRRANEEPR